MGKQALYRGLKFCVFFTLAVAERTVLCVRRGRPPIYNRGRADPTRSACGSLNLDFPLRRIRFVAPVSVERISDLVGAAQIADRVLALMLGPESKDMVLRHRPISREAL